MDIKSLYDIKEKLSVLESSKNDEKDKIEDLEQKVEDIKKKETRGFISGDEANDELSDVSKKLKKIKEKIKDK